MSAAKYVHISKHRAKEAEATLYAESVGSSYVYDTYDTHVDKCEVGGGIEIGLTMKHPHFHILLTINHWTYVQLDYLKMNHFLRLL